MLAAALLLAWPLQQALGPDLEAFRAAAETLLLEGGALPPDYRGALREMSPADRIAAIIFLRRSGLMTDRPWAIGDLLAPARETPETPEPTETPEAATPEAVE